MPRGELLLSDLQSDSLFDALRRSVVGRDRNDPDRYFILAFFDSYESAMVNSNLPETTEFGRKQQELLDAPMRFTDLDVVDDRS